MTSKAIVICGLQWPSFLHENLPKMT
jgi:hypothetical protein